MQEQSISRNRQIIAGLAVLILIVVIVGAVTLSSKKKTGNGQAVTTTAQKSDTTAAASTSNDTTSTTAATTGSPTASSSDYTDGSYSADGEYSSPGGNESINIKVTIKNGVITDTSAISGATDGEAEEYQNQFIKAYKSMVVGKSIDSVSLSRVSGSSLTSQGFNDAIDQIKADAKTG